VAHFERARIPFWPSDRIHADIVAAALAARGLRAEVLAGRVMVPDDEAKIARQVVVEAEPVRPEPDNPEL
jgi:hypothetical protein